MQAHAGQIAEKLEESETAEASAVVALDDTHEAAEEACRSRVFLICSPLGITHADIEGRMIDGDGVATHRACAHHEADGEPVLWPPQRSEFDERLKECGDAPCHQAQSESDDGLVSAKIRATNGSIPPVPVFHERRGHICAIRWQH